MERTRKLGLQPTKLGMPFRFPALCLRMVIHCRDRNLKQFYPQFLIGCHVAVVNKNVCCLRCLLMGDLHHSYHYKLGSFHKGLIPSL